MSIFEADVVKCQFSRLMLLSVNFRGLSVNFKCSLHATLIMTI